MSFLLNMKKTNKHYLSECLIYVNDELREFLENLNF